MQRFSKVRDSGKVVTLKFTTEDNDTKGTHHHEVIGEARPHPDFTAALQAFKPFAAQLLDLDDSYLATARVVSVSVSRKGDARGATIHLTRPCSKTTAPFNIHTPHVKELVDTGADEDEGAEPENPVGVWLPGMDEALDELEREAVAYVNGKREQGDLFEQPAEAHRNGTAKVEPIGAGA